MLSVSYDVLSHILKLLDSPHEYHRIARQLCSRSRKEWLPRVVDVYFLQINGKRFFSCMWIKDKDKHMVVNTTAHLIEFNVMPIFNESHCFTVFYGRTHKVENLNTYCLCCSVYNTKENTTNGGYRNYLTKVITKIAFQIEKNNIVRTDYDGSFQKVKEVSRSKLGIHKSMKCSFRFKDPKYNMIKKGTIDVIVLLLW
jgi:hypothetical protein